MKFLGEVYIGIRTAHIFIISLYKLITSIDIPNTITKSSKHFHRANTHYLVANPLCILSFK